MIAFTAGPRLSISSMRAEYFSTSDRAVNLPDFIPSCSSEIVISSSSNGLTSRRRRAVQQMRRHDRARGAQRRIERGGAASS